MSPREGKNKILRLDGPLVRARPASVLTRRLYSSWVVETDVMQYNRFLKIFRNVRQKKLWERLSQDETFEIDR